MLSGRKGKHKVHQMCACNLRQTSMQLCISKLSPCMSTWLKQANHVPTFGQGLGRELEVDDMQLEPKPNLLVVAELVSILEVKGHPAIGPGSPFGKEVKLPAIPHSRLSMCIML